jgi:hypothetical protein
MELESINNFKIEDLVNQDILNSIKEIQQPRSRFQLEHFVLNQHDTEEMRFYQCVLEIQSMRTSLRIVSLEIEKRKIEIEKLKASGDAIDAIDARIKEISLEETEIVAKGTIREFNHLIDLYNSFPKKYTREEIDALQPVYWTKRLIRQVELDNLGNRGTVNPAHLEALRQIGELDLEAILLQQSQQGIELNKKEIQ